MVTGASGESGTAYDGVREEDANDPCSVRRLRETLPVPAEWRAGCRGMVIGNARGPIEVFLLANSNRSCTGV